MANSDHGKELWSAFTNLDALRFPMGFDPSNIIGRIGKFRPFLKASDIDKDFVTGETGIIELRLATYEELLQGVNTDWISKLFLYLYRYDLLQLVRRHYSTPREEPVQYRSLVKFLGPGTSLIPTPDDSQMMAELNRDAQHGELLNNFCAEFTNGSILFLVDQLNESFLSSNPALRGPAIDNAFANLRRLNLRRYADDYTRATEFASLVRNGFIGWFR